MVDGAIVHGSIEDTADLPAGYTDHQEPGSYRLENEGGDALFRWAVGPASWKSSFFPPHETVWRATAGADGRFNLRETDQQTPPVAVFGARPCEVAAMRVLDRVLAEGDSPDRSYVRRRSGTFVVAAECTAPAATCFCTSMGTGPASGDDVDMTLCELPPDGDAAGYRYLVVAGSERGESALAEVPHRQARSEDLADRVEALANGRESRWTRSLDVDGLPELLARNLDHPRWEETAQRCLSCGNCTMVCPTCFCSDIHDVSDIDGGVARERSWGSCFDRDHSLLHGGPVRSTTASCYRQWMTHKL